VDTGRRLHSAVESVFGEQVERDLVVGVGEDARVGESCIYEDLYVVSLVYRKV
jgi:hypothetical protein